MQDITLLLSFHCQGFFQTEEILWKSSQCQENCETQWHQQQLTRAVTYSPLDQQTKLNNATRQQHTPPNCHAIYKMISNDP